MGLENKMGKGNLFPGSVIYIDYFGISYGWPIELDDRSRFLQINFNKMPILLFGAPIHDHGGIMESFLKNQGVTDIEMMLGEVGRNLVGTGYNRKKAWMSAGIPAAKGSKGADYEVVGAGFCHTKDWKYSLSEGSRNYEIDLNLPELQRFLKFHPEAEMKIDGSVAIIKIKKG